MYKNFFRFRERPFKLVPNPDYLFLSRSHEEALAHLTYAVSEGEGFVLITGEVGTGKTTLCRSFLENLDESTKTAFIFNPKLDSTQLIKAINDEFGVDSTAGSIKELIDALNIFLIEQKRDANNVIILIDEAQNLTRDVLEQLRLLSNLETTRDKLMQIILVGQPELGEMLDSPELRQLAQRITLSCHLRPFNPDETKSYIEHRISVASVKPTARFTNRAISAVYQYAGGVPRRINIVCDRALLTAFGLDEKIITPSIVRTAIRELSGKGDTGPPWFLKPGQLVYTGLAICLVLIILLVYTPFKTQPPETGVLPEHVFTRKSTPEPETTHHTETMNHVEIPPATIPPAPPEPSAAAEKMTADIPSEDPATLDFEEYLIAADERNSRQNAIETVMAMWSDKTEIKPYLLNVRDDREFFGLAARQNGFLVQRIMNDFDMVKKLNLPAVLAFHSPGTLSPVYLTLNRLENGLVMLKKDPGDSGISVTMDELLTYYSGTAYIPWKNFFDYKGVIPANATEDTIITLKMHIRDIGFENVDITPRYDNATRRAVKMVQQRHGLDADGLVGPLTKIILYNEVLRLNIPLISS
jgi:general secretion pathway protein A